jgi:ubiquinone/menaquinone biosynthesis C-methylase UbiE
MLPEGDKTPADWQMPRDHIFEVWLKKPLRRLLYPAYLKLISPFVQRRFDPDDNLQVDQWYWGNRGLEFELLRTRLHRLIGITGQRVLVAGCGTGRDLPSWLQYQPLSLLGVDYFNYRRAWEALTSKYRGHQISFIQGELGNLDGIEDESVDIVGSDAVFEHVQDLAAVLKEFYRILRPDGAIYATFGPLWYSWGGDHISGYDCLASGYSHLVLNPESYEEYLESAGAFSHSEHDGRTWIKHRLFSYLRPKAYLGLLQEAGFSKLHLGLVLEPRAIRCLRENPEIKLRLLEMAGELDLILTGITLIYKKV